MGVEVAEEAETSPAAPRKRRFPWRTAVCWALALPGALWAIMRAFGLERGDLVPPTAFTPYVAAWSLVPAVVALVLRRWRPGAVAGLAVLAFAVAVLPRAVPDGNPPAGGPTLRVMTANVLVGAADPVALVAQVKRRRADLLALQEFTPEMRAGLDAAGIAAVLPYRELHDDPGASGSGIYSRFPLRDGGVHRHPESTFLQAEATVMVPGAPPVEFESVHPCPPGVWLSMAAWRREVADQPHATPAGALRVLAGDFNATLDHEVLRELIGTGYRDAADVAGKGLVGTWGPYDGDPLPPVTIDHVLADRRIGVGDVSVHRTPGSDHRNVVAELTLPRDSP